MIAVGCVNLTEVLFSHYYIVMNEELNSGSEIEGPGNRRLKGQLLDAQLASPKANRSATKKNQLELLITEEELFIWDLLAKGATQKEVSKKLDVAPATVMRRINKALEKVRGWAGREAEDWRNRQLLIIDAQISGIIKETNAQPQPVIDKETGEQKYSKADYPLWIVSPESATKARNMARVTLQKYLQHQANLLQLTVERKEIIVDKKVAIGVYNFGDFEGAASMDDL